MIKLTNRNNNPIWVSPENITAVNVTEDGAGITTNATDVHFVQEEPEEVVKKIMDYKKAMARYHNFLLGAVDQVDPELALELAEDDLKKLYEMEENK